MASKNESDGKIEEDYDDLGNEFKPVESVLLKEGMYWKYKCK